MHVVQFYDSDAFQVDAVDEFLRAGLRAGEPVLIIATAAHRAAAVRLFAEHHHDVGALSAAGLFTALDADEVLARVMIGGQPDPRLFDEVVGGVVAAAVARSSGRPFRAYGEMVDLLWRSGQSVAALQLEELWNELGRRHAFSLLCTYMMDGFRGAQHERAFAAICERHSRVVPTERYIALDDADSRLRAVSALQQRARALEDEIERREAVEAALRGALELRDDFLSVAGHELRTPLTVLRLQLTSLLAHCPTSVGSSHERRLASVAAQTERLSLLAERLLDASQLTGELTLQRRELDLASLVRGQIAAMADVAAAANCTVRMTGDGDVVGYWDAERVEGVVQDLLSNAFKFGRGFPVQVLVRGLRDRAELVVRDGGMGIARQDQARIFERFERRAPTDSFGGLGLGLWVARRVVEAHGGEIRVDSVVGGGATFTVALPYDACDGAYRPAPSA